MEYVIPNGTTKIGDFAFNKTTSVKSIRIPATVTHIGDNNFIECNNLTDIYFEGTQEQWNALNYLLEDNITLHILK